MLKILFYLFLTLLHSCEKTPEVIVEAKQASSLLGSATPKIEKLKDKAFKDVLLKSFLDIGHSIVSIQTVLSNSSTPFDSFEFYICPKNDPSTCKLNKENSEFIQGLYTESAFNYPLTAPGENSVYIRACKEVPRDNTCAEWQSYDFFHINSKDPQAAILLEKKYEADKYLNKIGEHSLALVKQKVIISDKDDEASIQEKMMKIIEEENKKKKSIFSLTDDESSDNQDGADGAAIGGTIATVAIVVGLTVLVIKLVQQFRKKSTDLKDYGSPLPPSTMEKFNAEIQGYEADIKSLEASGTDLPKLKEYKANLETLEAKKADILVLGTEKAKFDMARKYLMSSDASIKQNGKIWSADLDGYFDDPPEIFERFKGKSLDAARAEIKTNLQIGSKARLDFNTKVIGAWRDIASDIDAENAEIKSFLDSGDVGELTIKSTDSMTAKSKVEAARLKTIPETKLSWGPSSKVAPLKSLTTKTGIDLSTKVTPFNSDLGLDKLKKAAGRIQSFDIGKKLRLGLTNQESLSSFINNYGSDIEEISFLTSYLNYQISLLRLAKFEASLEE